MLPFSNRAKPWEYKGKELRRLAEVDEDELLDPHQLAARVGLRVVEASFAMQLLPQEKMAYLLQHASDSWSGGVYPKRLQDGTRICILNPQHARRRNRITLMEEVSHIHLGHVPTTLTCVADGHHIRDYDQDQEGEAYGVGAAALIPWSTFFRMVNAGSTIPELAEAYDVTTELIGYRLKITAAYNLYRSRQGARVTQAAGRHF